MVFDIIFLWRLMVDSFGGFWQIPVMVGGGCTWLFLVDLCGGVLFGGKYLILVVLWWLVAY